MRFQQDHQPLSSLGVDTVPHSSSGFPGFPAPLLNVSSAYSSDASHFYAPNSSLFSLETRTRHHSQENPSASSIAHARRPATLQNQTYNTREIYSRAIPSYPGRFDHASRNSATSTLPRQLPLSPTPSPSIGFTSPNSRMDSSHFTASQASTIPPLLPITMKGRLSYNDPANTPLTLDIQGIIDKGFFFSEGDWTCYRRNYFTCICAYNYTPMLPNNIQYIPQGSSQTYSVYGFAMSISAVVAEGDTQQIDLVQHTPKRDKGPVNKPDKVRLEPKPLQPLGLYGVDSHARMYENGYITGGRGNYPTDHTFERIQFKQATANNGKRRAKQQYYHLVIELYAEVGSQHPDGYVKVAERKSAKMIVRGRSPGHYQQDRRGSTGSGGGSGSALSGYQTQVLPASDYTPSTQALLPSTFSSGFETRQANHFPTTRHHEMSRDIALSDEPKMVSESKDYQYFPAPIYEHAADASQSRVEMFSHQRTHTDHMLDTRHPMIGDTSKVKQDYEGNPNMYNAGPAYYSGNCQRYEGRSSSSGYYPTPVPPQTG